MQEQMWDSRKEQDELQMPVGGFVIREMRNLAAGVLWLLLVREILRHRLQRR